ncbi:MAG: hypothetical protein J3K34DRAFT_462922 [Monoraphidium minutum]|nr:MAG: hypothetical protein J3K34DRAFT_462922 [Monoraphidium minutum]
MGTSSDPKQRGISSFFKPTGDGGASKAAAKDAAKENKRAAAPAAKPATITEAGGGGRQLKRLKRAAGGAAAQEQDEGLEDAMDEDARAPSQEPPAAPAAAAAPATAGQEQQQGEEGKGPAAAGEGAGAMEEAEAAAAEEEEEVPKGRRRRAPTKAQQQQEEDEEEEAGGGGAAEGRRREGGGGKEAPAASPLKVEGVGTGALEAAARHAAVDVGKLVTWQPGAPVPYAFLTSTFEDIAGTTKRLEIIAALTGCFRAILASTPGDLLPAVYLCSNRVGPPHEGLELGVGDAILIKALASSTGRKEGAIKSDYESKGDLGAVAAASRSAQRMLCAPPPLTIAGVFKVFREIAQCSGSKSWDRKRGLIQKLLVGSKGEEPGYIIRSLQGKLRIGLAEQSLLAALAHGASLHAAGPKGDRTKLAERLAGDEAIVKQVYSECPSFDRLVPALLAHPLAELPQHVTFTPGVPVRPMLAKATNGVAEVLEKFGDCEFTCEYKYDGERCQGKGRDCEFTCEYKYGGERCQIHIQQGGKVVALYSRNAEDQTPKFPDIVARVPSWLAEGTDSIVIDAEAVAWDPVVRRIQPFQVLSTRARKDVDVADIKVQVAVYAFDCLYLNGESLLHRPLAARRDALYGALTATEGQLAFATAKTSRDVEELAAFLNEAVAASTEGLIVKTMDDVYQPSRRSTHWLKLKKDYLDGCGDTFDVVPIGGYYGKGKRSGLYGAYLLAVYDDTNESYQTISKLGTGFSEEMLTQLDATLRPHALEGPRPYYQFGEGQAPDVWFDPVTVWEVKAADLSVSPVHQAARGLVDPGKGISIRFPRLLRVREDKSPEDATTAAQVADMYRAQAVVAANRKEDAGGDDDE